MTLRIIWAVGGTVLGFFLAFFLGLGLGTATGIVLGGAYGSPTFTGFHALALAFWTAVFSAAAGALYGGVRGYRRAA
jgi:hypothetical protein